MEKGIREIKEDVSPGELRVLAQNLNKELVHEKKWRIVYQVITFIAIFLACLILYLNGRILDINNKFIDANDKLIEENVTLEKSNENLKGLLNECRSNCKK